MTKKIGTGIPRLVTLTLVFSAFIAIAAAAEGSYHLIKKIPIPGDGGLDYVAADSDGRRLYVSHDTEIVVIDLDTGAIVGKITGGPDMHGAAIASEFGRGFISVSNPGSVVIFDLKTLAVRVIIDGAADALPAAVAAAADRAGHLRLWRLIGALTRSPAELAPLIRLARRYRTASRSLAALARAGPLARHA